MNAVLKTFLNVFLKKNMNVNVKEILFYALKVNEFNFYMNVPNTEYEFTIKIIT